MARGVVANAWSGLTPFLPPYSKTIVGAAGVMSFVGGLAESAILVIITLTADSLIRGVADIELLGRTVTQADAGLVALALVLVRVVLVVATAKIVARFSASVMTRSQSVVLARSSERRTRRALAAPPAISHRSSRRAVVSQGIWPRASRSSSPPPADWRHSAAPRCSSIRLRPWGSPCSAAWCCSGSARFGDAAGSRFVGSSLPTERSAPTPSRLSRSIVRSRSSTSETGCWSVSTTS